MGLSLDMQCAIHRGGGGGGDLYGLLSWGLLIKITHASIPRDHLKFRRRWEGSYGVWIVELIYSWIRYSVGSIRRPCMVYSADHTSCYLS